VSEFQRVLNRLLAESGKSTTLVCKLGGVDRAYLIRLLEGTKTNPSTETLMRIWLGLAMDARVVAEYPTFVHGLVELLHASAMSSAPLRLAEEK
jgi:hypothetical protein